MSPESSQSLADELALRSLLIAITPIWPFFDAVPTTLTVEVQLVASTLIQELLYKKKKTFDWHGR